MSYCPPTPDQRYIHTWPRHYWFDILVPDDYPPGSLTRNPPGYWTPEAHP